MEALRRFAAWGLDQLTCAKEMAGSAGKQPVVRHGEEAVDANRS